MKRRTQNDPFLHPEHGLKQIFIRENGLVGTLFTSGSPSRAVMVLGGAGGGVKESYARRLAENGFAALALAYFGVDPLPSRLAQIPLEYFQKAIARVRQEPNVKQIGLWGESRGAELSLILASLFPFEIDAIAAHVPSSVVYGAFDPHNTPAWLCEDKPVAPNAPFFGDPDGIGLDPEEPIRAAPWFLNAMKEQNAFQAAAIQVEKIRSPLLLISGEDDQMWPSTVFANQILDRLTAYRSPILRFHRSYPRVGHAPAKGESGFHPIFKRHFLYGGSPLENALAAEEWIHQTILFFQEYLQP